MDANKIKWEGSEEPSEEYYENNKEIAVQNLEQAIKVQKNMQLRLEHA